MRSPLGTTLIRAALAIVVSAFLVALLGFFAQSASASLLVRPETRVAAIAEPNGPLVRPTANANAVPGRGRAPNYDSSATGSCFAAEGGAGASTPIGRPGSPLRVAPGTNSPTTIDGIYFSGHAIDEMQSDGIMPSAVNDAIQNGLPESSRGGTTVWYSSQNNISVVRSASGTIITVSRGDLRP